MVIQADQRSAAADFLQVGDSHTRNPSIQTIKPSWYCLAILALILCLAAVVRFDGITRTSLWGDEYQSLFLSTGRGDAVMNIPHGVIVNSPPPVGFDGAPSFTHIWTSLDSTVHPPLFHVLLRLWIDCFGDTDLSIRGMSSILGLAGILLLFDAIRLLYGPWHAILGAAMMAFAPVQLDFCQQARPYTLMAVFCLTLFLMLIRIERNGVSSLKLATLFLAALAAALTHYFAIGTVFAALLYVAFKFKGRARWQSAGAILLAILIFAVVWGPILWTTRDLAQSWMQSNFRKVYHLDSLTSYLLAVPERLTFGPIAGYRWPAVIAIGILVYVIPLLSRGKAFIWYLWVLGSIAGPLAIDIRTSSSLTLIGMDKYIFLAAPGVYAILAAALCGRLIAIGICLGVAIFGAARWQSGPGFSYGSTLGLEDHRTQAKFLATHVQKDDLVILPSAWVFNNQIDESAFTYFILAHYKGEWKTPVLLLTSPLSGNTRAEFSHFRRIWVAGSSQSDCAKMLPGFDLNFVGDTTYRDSVWAIK